MQERAALGQASEHDLALARQQAAGLRAEATRLREQLEAAEAEREAARSKCDRYRSECERLGATVYSVQDMNSTLVAGLTRKGSGSGGGAAGQDECQVGGAAAAGCRAGALL